MTQERKLEVMTHREAMRHLKDRRLKFGDALDIHSVRLMETVAEAKRGYYKRKETDEDFHVGPPDWDNLTLEQAQHYIIWGRAEF